MNCIRDTNTPKKIVSIRYCKQHPSVVTLIWTVSPRGLNQPHPSTTVWTQVKLILFTPSIKGPSSPAHAAPKALSSKRPHFNHQSSAASLASNPQISNNPCHCSLNSWSSGSASDLPWASVFSSCFNDFTVAQVLFRAFRLGPGGRRSIVRFASSRLCPAWARG